VRQVGQLPKPQIEITGFYFHAQTVTKKGK